MSGSPSVLTYFGYGEFVSAGTREVIGFCILVIFEVFYLYFVMKHGHSVQNAKNEESKRTFLIAGIQHEWRVNMTSQVSFVADT